MDTLIDKEVYKGCTIDIHADYDACDPRENDNLGTMVCFHRRYALGDKHELDLETAILVEQDPQVISLPLYLYDHSGITMNTTGFSCPWDSGKVGFIYVTLDKVRAEFSVKRVGKALRRKVEKILKGEVEYYDKYLTGSFVGFIIEAPDSGDIDSCWGFSDKGDMLKECRAIIDQYWKERTRVRKEERAEERKLKAWNQVFDKFYAPILF